jgi:hypothetical protein
MTHPQPEAQQQPLKDSLSSAERISGPEADGAPSIVLPLPQLSTIVCSSLESTALL